MTIIMENNNESKETIKHSDFSIDHILNRAGSSFVNNNCEKTCDNLNFQWLQCSRYCPPKIPRMYKKEIQKRQLGRHPRIPFTSNQLLVLEQKFKESPYLGSEEVVALSKKLQLADIRVKIWFQNRRARERREKHRVDNKDKIIAQKPDEIINKRLETNGSKKSEQYIVNSSFNLPFSNSPVPSSSNTRNIISEIYNNNCLTNSIFLPMDNPLLNPSINSFNKINFDS